MDWLKLLVAIFIPVVSWVVVHLSGSSRDRRNKLRDERIKFLTEAFRLLAKAPHHPKIHEVGDDLNSAVAIIQFYGTDKQIDLVHRFVQEFATGQADLDSLFHELRNDLRNELGLSGIKKRWWWLRVAPQRRKHNKAN